MSKYVALRRPLGVDGYCCGGFLRPVWSVVKTAKARARLRVVIADDHPTILRMIRTILGAQAHLEVIGEAPDGIEAVAMVKLLKPDVVILNVVMPRMSGLEAARKIHAQSPSVSIVILSTHKDEQFIAAARASGATGYVEKRLAEMELVNAIDATASGKEFFLH